jgi:hypothetical protein
MVASRPSTIASGEVYEQATFGSSYDLGLSVLVRFIRLMGDQSLRMTAKLTFEHRYDELFDANGRGENRIMTTRAMNVVCLSGRAASRHKGDAGR